MPIVIGGLILAFLVMLLFGGTEIDRGFLILFSSGEAPRLREAADIIRLAGGPFPLLLTAAAGLAALLVLRRWRDAALLAGIIVAGRLLVEGAQRMSANLRPGIEERLLPAQDLAFPSGQTANATITAFALAFLLTRHRPARPLALSAAAGFALAMGAAQLLLGASWPSDVIGGWALGLAWTFLLLMLARADLGDGTARPVRHSPPRGDDHGREPQNRDRPPE